MANTQVKFEGWSRWHRYTKLALMLLGSSLILETFPTTIARNVIKKSNNKTLIHQTNADSSVCASSSCKKTAERMTKSLNEKQDPCDDFYEFACGGWIRDNSTADNQFDSINLALQNALKIIKNLLESNNSYSSSAITKARAYYKSCLDERDRKDVIPKIITEVIKNIGGWHLLPTTMTKKQNFDLQKLLLEVNNKCHDSPLLFHWETDDDDFNLILTKEGVYNDNETIIVDELIKIYEKMGANASEVKTQFTKVLQLRKELSEITAQSDDEETDFYDTYTIQEWQTVAPFLNWSEYFNGVFSSPNFTMLYNESLYVDDAEYFFRFGDVITKYNKTEEGQKTIVNFMMRHLTVTLFNFLNNSEITDPIASRCLAETMEEFQAPITTLFVRHTMTNKTKSQVQVISKNIRIAYKEIIKKAVWMNAATQQAVLERIDNVYETIGYTDYVLDSNLIDEDYKELAVDPVGYYYNKLAVYEFDYLKTVRRSYTYLINKTYEEDPSTIIPPLKIRTAHYRYDLDFILIPASIMQLPVYNDDTTMSFNYGVLGTIIGHELTHAILSDVTLEWISKEDTIAQTHVSSEKYCVVDQYTNYTINGLNLNGTNTWAEEDLADIGGLKASFYAYLNYSKMANVNFTLPGVDFNHRQQFFISYAQLWCRSYKDDQLIKQLKTDEHSVNKYRVIGPLSNLKEFSEEFQCPVGSRMNPEQKCLMW